MERNGSEHHTCPEVFEKHADSGFCPPVFDGYLCWPETPAGNKVVLPCPKGVPGLDENSFVARDCLSTGRWFSCSPPPAAAAVTQMADGTNVTSSIVISDDKGWTNFSSCFTENTRKLMKDLNHETGCPRDDGDDDTALKLLIAKISRVMEVFGYSLSLLVLFFALVAFCYFRKLRKHKVTRIHMNLFASMILQSFVRLVIYIDQFIVREDGFTGGGSRAAAAGYANGTMRGIDNTPFLCQTFYTLIEYGKTAMFLWMFIEGLILHHMTSVAFSRGPDDQKKFYFSGWLIPIPLVLLWLVANQFDKDADNTHCGQGYGMLVSYWILEGPRIFVIVLNIFILLNVTRVLFTHLSGNEDSDINQIRKSLKSLLFLLPLLGITNILHHLWPNPLRGSWISFAIWSLATHFLYSFQGVFVACVYFFFDQKVKTTLYTFWILKVTLRERDSGGCGGGGGAGFGSVNPSVQERGRTNCCQHQQQQQQQQQPLTKVKVVAENELELIALASSSPVPPLQQQSGGGSSVGSKSGCGGHGHRCVQQANGSSPAAAGNGKRGTILRKVSAASSNGLKVKKASTNGGGGGGGFLHLSRPLRTLSKFRV